MALPASGPISLHMIQAEFGGPTPINLQNYYRGGLYVPNTAQNASIPTSGPITIPNNFWGASALSVSIADHTVFDLVFEPANASATYELLNTGVARKTEGAVTTNFPGEWLLAGTAANYEARATVLSGSFTSGTFGSYLNLGTTRTWGNAIALGPGGTGDAVGTMLVEIRPAGGGAVLDSATILINATIDP